MDLLSGIISDSNFSVSAHHTKLCLMYQAANKKNLNSADKTMPPIVCIKDIYSTAQLLQSMLGYGREIDSNNEWVILTHLCMHILTDMFHVNTCQTYCKTVMVETHMELYMQIHGHTNTFQDRVSSNHIIHNISNINRFWLEGQKCVLPYNSCIHIGVKQLIVYFKKCIVPIVYYNFFLFHLKVFVK